MAYLRDLDGIIVPPRSLYTLDLELLAQRL